MRNLKRVLSLTLASVMLMGMMVVGSNAAAGYDDVSETDNVEAIEVLQTIEVMVGDERGFGPERPVNRAEMAVVMGKLLNLDYNYYSATCPFNDVYDWARGWVGACAANGIVSGRGDGVYDPGSTVTAVEAASMLMRALGYFKYQSDYADGFEVATVRQGTTIGIFKGVGSSATEAMTRNQVAQMVLNALKSGMVQPDGNTLNYFDSNGNVIATGGKINYVYVTSDEAYATAIRNVNATSMGSFNTNPIVELGEQLYSGNLKLYGEGSSIRDREWDVFGRPARRWEYKGQDIGTYVKKELLKQEYSAKVTGQTLYELLGKSVVDNYAFQIVIDGVDTTDNNAASILRGASFDKNDLYRTNKDAVGRTGKGVQTLVYVDTDFDKSEDYHVYISIINTYLAKANEDYDTRDDDVSLRVWHLDYDGTIASPIFAKSNGDKPYEDYTSTDNDYTDVKAKGEDFDLVKDVKEDELYMVQVADGEIQTIMAPEILSAVTVDAFKLNDHVTTGGETYEYASTARYDVEAIENYTDGSGTINLKDLTYNVILDQYGYLIGLELNENNDQYVFLTGLEQGASNLYAKQVDGNIIHMDGTMETVKIDMTKSRCGQPGHTGDGLLAHNTGDAKHTNWSQLNTWCTYTVDTNGVYTLTMVPVSTTDNVTTTGPNAIKKAQYAQDVADDNDGPSEQESGIDTKSINTKRVSLKASNGNEYVYGNDKTVYITVSLEGIVVDDDFGSKYRWIVDDVDSVTTGVKNVDLKAIELGAAKNNTNGDTFYNPDAEIYTLYDNKGAVIAAVVIGDDEGTTSTYAYIHTSKLEEEIYNGNSSSRAAGDGKWTWTRYAIVNGVKTLLKEVDDQPEYLKAMKQGEWYEIKYDSDGNVRKATVVTPTNNNVGNGGDVAKWIAEVVDVEGSVNEYDNVVLLDVTTVNGLIFKNGTLWTTTDQTKGFSVHPDVKTVLAVAGKSGGSFNQSNRTFSGSAFDDTFDGYTGYNGLEQALREMNAEKSDNFTKTSVQIGAILENGRATTIVINDMNPAPDNRPGGGGSSQTSSVTTSSGAKDLVKDVTGSASVNSRGNGSWTVSVTAPEWVTSDAEADITYELYVNGKFDAAYTAEDVAGTNGVYTASNSDYGFNTDDKLTIEVTNVKWSKVHVKVEGADRVENPTPADALTAETATAGDIKFTVDTTKYTPESVTAAKYTVSGLNVTTAPTGTGVGSQVVISSVKALGTGYVTVNVTGLVAVTPPEPAKKFAVNALGNASGKVLFAVVDSEPTAQSDVTAVAAAEWKTSLPEVEEDKWVMVKSATDGVKLTNVTASDPSGVKSYTPADVVSSPGTAIGVYKIQVKSNVNVGSITDDAPTIEKISIAPDGTQVNIKMADGSGSFANDTAMFKAAVDFINNNVSGWTAVEGKPNAAGAISTIDITNSIGTSTVNSSVVKVSTTEIVVDGVPYVMNAAATGSSGGLTLEDALAVAGKTISGGGSAQVFVFTNKGTVGTYTTTSDIDAIATDDLTATVTSGAKEIVTNNGKGYVKLAASTPVTTSITATGSTDFNSTNGTHGAAAGLKATQNIVDDGSNKLAPIGQDITITLTLNKPSTAADLTKTATVKIAGDNLTLSKFGSATEVDKLKEGTSLKNGDTIDLTFQITAVGSGAPGALGVTLEDKA